MQISVKFEENQSVSCGKIKEKTEMKKVLVLMLLLIVGSSICLQAQQGKYVRKSVSSMESVWFKPGSLQMDFDIATFNKFMKFYVEVDRFDYNKLPESYIDEFLEKANALETINNTTLAEVLKGTVVQKILAILNDPEVMKVRGEELKSESDLQSFAAIKAKSIGLTTEELATLMNSAYIYLPFVTTASKSTDKKGNLTVSLEGGLIWWKINVAPDGSSSVDEVLSAMTRGVSTINPNMKTNPLTGAPKTFKFGGESWSTTPESWAQNDAMLAFAKNLGVKTKEIDDFKLTAQIMEVGPGQTYSFSLGRKEGVFLDDGFFLVEYEENAKGEDVKVNKGFVRVSRTGINIDDPTAYSKAVQILGSPVSEGTMVMEHPRLGMDAKFTMGMLTGSSILPYHTSYISLDDLAMKNVIKDKSTSMLVGNLDFTYNIAPIIGVSQTFINVDLGFGLPIAEYESSADGAAYVISTYMGANKKFGRQMYFTAGAGFGYDMLRISYSDLGSIYNLDYTALGVRAYGEAGYLLSADLGIFCSLGYRMGFASDYDDMNLGGLMINAGVSYSLGELPINIFGFLDPFKKY